MKLKLDKHHISYLRTELRFSIKFTESNVLSEKVELVGLDVIKVKKRLELERRLLHKINNKQIPLNIELTKTEGEYLVADLTSSVIQKASQLDATPLSEKSRRRGLGRTLTTIKEMLTQTGMDVDAYIAKQKIAWQKSGNWQEAK